MSEKSKSRKISPLYVAFIAALFVGLVMQFVFPQSMDRKVASYLKDCNTIIVQQNDGNVIHTFTTESLQQKEQFAEWAGKIKTRSRSIGSDMIGSEKETLEACTVIFDRAGGIRSFIIIDVNGHVKDSAKRYTIVNYSEETLNSLYAITADWKADTVENSDDAGIQAADEAK